MSAAMDNNQDLLRRLQSLRNMTVARGCTAAEADVAALKIGQLLQQHPIVFCTGACQQKTSQKPNGAQPGRASAARHSYYEQAEDDFEYGYVDVLGTTEKAIFLRGTNGEEFWMPRSQLRGGCESWDKGDSGMLYTSDWWARKQGWE